MEMVSRGLAGANQAEVGTVEPNAVECGDGMVCVIGQELPSLTRLRATANHELTLHVHDDQLKCIACGEPWPCERASLAAFTLGAL
jgi:hypothetical protein